MTAGQQVVPQPILHGRIVAVALAATFAGGLLTGLVAPLVRLPDRAATVSASVDPAASTAWLAYRAGERVALVLPSQPGDTLWLAYRDDERAVGIVAAPLDDEAWLVYRAGARGDPGR